jgi:hypothetical protein
MPEIPSQGDNAALLNWSLQCASAVRQCAIQLNALKDIEEKQND